MEHERRQFILPISVVSPADLGRLCREVQNLNETFTQLKLRNPGENSASLPKLSRPLEITIDANGLNILKESDRSSLVTILSQLQTKAPNIHVSFSSEAEGSFIEKLTTWLRREIHPYLLLSVGLQPTIGAGCIIRSTNKYFDLSLKQDFANKKDLIGKLLTEQPTAAPQPTVPAPVPSQSAPPEGAVAQ